MADMKIYRLKRAVIKEEYVAITDDMLQAVILNQMIYWSERVNDFDSFIKEEQQHKRLEGKQEDNLTLSYGWIHKSANELKNEIMCGDSQKTIMRKLDNLVEKGFLDRRNNPDHPYDRVYQYRVNFAALLEALKNAGYTLEGYRVDFETDDKTNTEYSLNPEKEQNIDGPFNAENRVVQSNGQNVPSNCQNDVSERHDVPAIPETTTKITTEITSSSPYPSKPEQTEEEDKDNAGELAQLFDAMRIEQLRDRNLIAPMKSVISNLWSTLRVGNTAVSRQTVKKALFCLSPEIIESIFDKFDRQKKKGHIVVPTEYIKALILNASQEAELLRITDNGKATESEPSFDIDEYVKLSLKCLNEK